MPRAREHVGILAVGFGVALFVGLACEWVYPTTAFRCRPASVEPCPPYGGRYYHCCSDDPAALDLANLDAAVVPSYQGRADGGTPLFSATRNSASEWGMCVQVGSVAPAFALADVGAQGCPIPCNPQRDVASIESVCGMGAFCCQTTEIEEEDCVFDPALGDDGCFRPVRGEDIDGFGGLEATDWSAHMHVTHQDPGGRGCQAFAEGLNDAQLDDAGVTADEVFRACVRRLGVANQRGYCIGGPGVVGCPLAQPGYRDACEQMNDAEGLGGCG